MAWFFWEVNGANLGTATTEITIILHYNYLCMQLFLHAIISACNYFCMQLFPLAIIQSLRAFRQARVEGILTKRKAHRVASLQTVWTRWKFNESMYVGVLGAQILRSVTQGVSKRAL